jgi:thioredoxin 1
VETLDEKTFKAKVFDYEAEKGWKYAGNLPAVVDFYADWCAPCRALAPVMTEIAGEYAGKIHVYKVDTEASPELAGLFGVRSIPSILFIPMDGKPSMATGLLPKQELKKAIKETMNVPEPTVAAAG